MNFNEKDKQFCKEITDLLWQRQRINANKLDGQMPMQPEWEDRVSPEITITLNAIKDRTGRDKIRDVIMNKYERDLQSPGVQVKRVDGTLKISIVQTRTRENVFGSIKELRTANELDLEKDSGLNESPY